MSNFLIDLEEYFENTSNEQIKKDWEKSKEWDKIGMNMSTFKAMHSLGKTKFKKFKRPKRK